jgi:hypothetical protein
MKANTDSISRDFTFSRGTSTTRILNFSIKEILILETLADNPLIDESKFQQYSQDELNNLKKEKKTHSSLFIIKSLDLDEGLPEVDDARERLAGLTD